MRAEGLEPPRLAARGPKPRPALAHSHRFALNSQIRPRVRPIWTRRATWTFSKCSHDGPLLGASRLTGSESRVGLRTPQLFSLRPIGAKKVGGRGATVRSADTPGCQGFETPRGVSLTALVARWRPERHEAAPDRTAHRLIAELIATTAYVRRRDRRALRPDELPVVDDPEDRRGRRGRHGLRPELRIARRAALSATLPRLGSSVRVEARCRTGDGKPCPRARLPMEVLDADALDHPCQLHSDVSGQVEVNAVTPEIQVRVAGFGPEEGSLKRSVVRNVDGRDQQGGADALQHRVAEDQHPEPRRHRAQQRADPIEHEADREAPFAAPTIAQPAARDPGSP
jgi:hypothetical protein